MTFTIKINASSNPWLTEYIEIEFSRKKFESIADELIEECSNKKYNVSYAYGKHVEKVLNRHWDKECGSIVPFYKAVLFILKEKKKPGEGWWGGATAAIRCIMSRIAYATPGFIEAKRYSEMYGGD